MTARGFAEFFHESAPALLKEFAAIAKQAEIEFAAGHHVAAAQLSLRGLETANKLAWHFNNWRNLMTAMSALNRSKEYNWPSLEWDAWSNQVTSIRSQLIATVANAAAHLHNLPDEGMLPDLFGQTYSVLGDECISAIIEGDEARFQDLFRAFFPATLAMSGKLVQRRRDSSPAAFALMSAPFLDAMAISGCAEIFGALDNRSFGATARDGWDTYLATLPDESARRASINLMLSLTEPSFWSSPREGRRWRWKQATEQELRRRGVITERFGEKLEGNPEMRGHASAVIRALAATYSLLTNSEDVFAATYLLARPEAAGVEPNWKLRSFVQEMARRVQGNTEEGSDEA
jgi:hypothetical protein